MQVLHLLARLPSNGGMASVVKLDELHRVECDLLARIFQQMPRAQRQAPFWVDLACMLIKRCQALLSCSSAGRTVSDLGLHSPFPECQLA